MELTKDGQTCGGSACVVGCIDASCMKTRTSAAVIKRCHYHLHHCDSNSITVFFSVSRFRFVHSISVDSFIHSLITVPVFLPPLGLLSRTSRRRRQQQPQQQQHSAPNYSAHFLPTLFWKKREMESTPSGKGGDAAPAAAAAAATTTAPPAAVTMAAKSGDATATAAVNSNAAKTAVPAATVSATTTTTVATPSASATIPTAPKSSAGVPSSSSTQGATPAGAATGSSSNKSLKKGARKKRKAPPADGSGGTPSAEDAAAIKKAKKLKRKKEDEKAAALAKKKAKKQAKKLPMAAAANPLAHLEPPGLTPAQKAVNEQMRKALEEDQYSANGSIVDTDTDEEDHQYVYKGQAVRLDRTYLSQAARNHNWLGGGATSGKPAAQEDVGDDDDDDDEDILAQSTNGKPKKSKIDKKRRGRNQYATRAKEDASAKEVSDSGSISREASGSSSADDIPERDEGSIFGQTTGASNATWVECDKCKKWRRLRGVVDERKLPPKWYCSMNKNDPDRARCSAPEEEYDAAQTPESAADARTRKHLRVWVRRLQCNEQYESRMPTLTRGKKRAVATSSKEPPEWIRCCNPSCGKWRAVLRIMDAKQNVIERTSNGEWYCVMNTWDEKTASCAAPQENLPAVGCPPWVIQDED